MAIERYFSSVFFLGSLLQICFCGQTVSDLRTELLENYVMKVPPETAGGVPVMVQIGLIINHFSLADMESTFSANVWLSLTWIDSRLSWNQSQTNGTFNLKFTNQDIWTPDLTLINNASPTDTWHYGETQLIVNSDGRVLWTPPSQLVSHCNLNLIRWPYDEHTCVLKIGSWTHSGKEIDLELSEKVDQDPEHAIDRSLFITNYEWTLIKTEAVKENEYYACCENPYAVVKYSFRIKRNSPSYVATIILPIIVISIVNVMVFLLPPTAGEKITLASINSFILCVFLIYFEARLPPLGDHLPLLVLLYACNLVLIGFSLVMSVIVINISRNRKASSPPQCFRMFCNANFAQFLGLGYIVPYVSQTHCRLDEGVEMRPPRENGRASFDVTGDKDDHFTNLVVDSEPPYLVNAEWILLGAMIDRLTLIIYIVVSGVTMGLCLA